MSTFSLDDGTSATFIVDVRSFKNAGPWPRELSVVVNVDDSADTNFEKLLSMQSWNVHVDRAIGGSTVWVDVGSGAGEGDLVIDDIGSWTAVLTDVSAEAPIGASGKRFINLSFLLTGVL